MQIIGVVLVLFIIVRASPPDSGIQDFPITSDVCRAALRQGRAEIQDGGTCLRDADCIAWQPQIIGILPCVAVNRDWLASGDGSNALRECATSCGQYTALYPE